MSELKDQPKVEPTEAIASPTTDEPKNNENGAIEAKAEDTKTEAEDTKTAADAKTELDTDNTEAKAERQDAGPRTYDNGMLKTSVTAKSQWNKNSKYDPSVLKTSENPKDIRGQIEFYFSDSNLPTDKFMMDTTKGPENLPVSIKTLHSFGRMRRFQPYAAVVAALRDSKFLNVTGEEGEELVSRKVAFDPEAPVSKTESRSVYVKGFGDEEPSSQFDIEAFFAQFGSTNAVRLRRTVEKLFKGSVFVEWSDEETAKKFLALDPQPKWKGKHILSIMSKAAYQEMKEKEIQDGITQPSESWGPSRGRGRGRGRGSRNGQERGDRDPNDWKKRREDDRSTGFKNDRKGQRGRGRRGDRGGERGPRANDRNREREEKNEGKSEDKQVTENEKKRPREDDGTPEQPAKKVDTKPEVAAEA